MLLKLKKPLYGLNDPSHKFWFRVKGVFADIRLQILEGYEAFYLKHGNDAELKGIVSMHVDNFNFADKT